MGNAHGERRLAQARRPVEEDVPERFLPFRGRIDGNLQPGIHLPLPDHIPHSLGTQIAVFVLEFGGLLEDGYAAHGPARASGDVNGC